MQPLVPVRVVRPVTNLIREARQGVLRRRVDEVARSVGLTDKEMAHILNMSVRGLHGKSASETLSLSASERLLLLERLVQHGLSVFDGRADLLNRWLHTPLHELAYRDGIEEVPLPVSTQNLGRFGDPFELSPTTSGSVSEANEETLSALLPQSPLAVLDTVSGFSLADDVLGRIEWGIAG